MSGQERAGMSREQIKTDPDIVERLCDAAFYAHPSSQIGKACCDAADEIERLRSLITAWADADDVFSEYSSDQKHDALELACDALRAEVGR